MKHVLFIALLLPFVLPCAGQREMKTYRGAFGMYSYYLNSKEERVWHGECIYSEGRNIAKGRFVNGKKDGRWVFNEPIDGVCQIVTIDFSKGRIDGSYKDSKHTLAFLNGRLVGTVMINGVSCMFDNDGFPDGTWTYSFTDENNIPFTITNEFKHGVWISGILTDESTGVKRTHKPEYCVSAELFFANYNSETNTAVIRGKTYKLKRGLKWNSTYRMSENTPLPSMLNDIVKHSFFNGGEYLFTGVPRSEIIAVGSKQVSQTTQTNTNDDNKVYDEVDTPPSFQGGEAALLTYLRDNVTYPKVAADNGIEGRVVVQFVVGKDGTISNVVVARSADASLDKEAVRVMRNMPKWIPGQNKGVAVNVKYTCPVTFRLQ